MDMGHIFYIFPHPVGFSFEACPWQEMVGVQADKQLAGLNQIYLVDQNRDGGDIGKVRMKGFKAAGISQQFTARVQAMLPEILVARSGVAPTRPRSP